MARRAIKVDTAKVRELRQQCGFSIAELAQRAGVSIGTISRLEASSPSYVYAQTLRVVAAALSVPVDTLVFSPEVSSPLSPEPSSLSTHDITIEITINKDFDAFNEADQERLLKAISDLLSSGHELRIIRKRQGSTKISIRFTREEAECILWLQRRGVLDEYLVKHRADFKIQDTKLIGDAAASAIIEAKLQDNEFDVFLCHNSVDKLEIKRIAVRLRNHGILPWLDEWELRPGLPWQNALQERIDGIKSVAVFIGDNGIGPWQNMELNAFISQFVERRCPVIPVILRKCERAPNMPLFLKGMTWIDFKRRKPDPLDQLIWGITGKRV